MDVSTVEVKFSKRQQSATASIKIFEDEIIEKTEFFKLKMILPSSEVRRKLLKYGRHRLTTVYIKDSK